MINDLTLRTSPKTAASVDKLKNLLASLLNIKSSEINDFKITKRSIDARQKNIKINLNVRVAFSDDNKVTTGFSPIEFKVLPSEAPSVIIVGAGPAGLFGALKAIELGMKPIVIERGEAVEKRRKIISDISKINVLDPDTNYCFGEGGAGAYSDGKLFTRSKKKGDPKSVLNLFHQFGANEDILINTHAHIGSDRLPEIIRNIRNTIIEKGGEVFFNEKLTDFIIEDKKLKGIKTSSGKEFYGPVVLATGHSAHDVYKLLSEKGVKLDSKGLAVGVRVEHKQKHIDKIRYKTENGRGDFLPPAEYSFLTRIDGRAVYSFCMCPGGVVVPSMSAPGESLVNGMSASARAGRWANAAFVVEILPEDLRVLEDSDEDSKNEIEAEGLSLLKWQKNLEKKFFEAADLSLKAPAQRLTDFVNETHSDTLPDSSYLPGLISIRVDKVLPVFISERLKKAFVEINKKNPGFLTEDATVIGLESRTSSPVRIPRDPETLEHIEIKNLFPAGEGAGYSGGIVSSAIDGQRSVEAVFNKLK